MRTLFYYSKPGWTGSARAFGIAARGLVARGEPVTVVCRADSPAEQSFLSHELDVVSLPMSGAVAQDAWRLRQILRDKFIEVAFVHTEREQLIASSALRLAERGAVIRRVPVGCGLSSGRASKLAGRMAATRMLFSTEEDRKRANAGERAFVAPLGVSATGDARAASRATLGVDDETQLIVCVADATSKVRVTTALRTLALLAERHPDLRLALVGQGLDEEDMRMHAAALGVTTLVRYLGERDDLSFVAASADVGWVAADGDDGGFACLDFMAAKVPVIAERSPLLSHFVPDGIAGVLLPRADPSDTAAAVASFLADSNQREAMGRAGRTRAARDFAEQAMIDGFANAASAAGDRALWTAR